MKKRNITLDYFKIILSISVIYAHFVIPIIYDNNHYSEYLPYFGYAFIWQLTGLPKIAVPFFLMINGYYLSVSDRKKATRYVIRILKLYIVWMLLYLPWMPYDNSLRLILNLLLGFYQLWYLPALIGAVILFYFLNKVVKNTLVLLSFAIILFLIGYGIQMSGRTANTVYLYIYRNSIFYGLPYLIFGYLIRRADINKFRYLLPIIIAGIILMIIETHIYMEMVQYYEMYIAGLLLCPLAFIYLLQKSKMVEIKENEEKPSDLSSAIYYIHPIFILLFTSVLPQENSTLLYWFPLIVFFVLLGSFGVIQINKKIDIFL